MKTSRCSARRRLGALVSLVLIGFAPITVPAQVAPNPPSTPTSKEKQDAVQLSVFTVTEQKDIGYESMQTTSASRTVQALKNVPMSISILNAQLIEDTASLTGEEMMRWSASGEDNPEPLNAQVNSRVVLRGIPNAYAMRNGWIWYSPMDSYSTERIEVLRGPNSFLYGEADVGGANNQLTKRGVFGRSFTRVKAMFGSEDLRRGEIDINRPLIANKLALRVATVKSHNDSWIDNVRRDFWGVYAAASYRPFARTTIHVTAEHAEMNSVNQQGLFTDAFSRPQTTTIAASGGFIYLPANGLMYRAAGPGRVNSTGTGLAIADPILLTKGFTPATRPVHFGPVLPRNFHSAGPNQYFENYYQSVTADIEQDIGKNLHLQLSWSFYQRNIDQQNVQAGRNVFRDRNPTLPNGSPNPYFNELYTEYFRGRREHGNKVIDARLSAVYDWQPWRWMKQQFLVNLQQHQDNPYHFKPAWAEFVDESNPNFLGTINRDITQAAFTANRATFTSNRFVRRYYFQRDGVKGNWDLGPVPGVSAWYPDLGNAVPASGHQLWRRFYTPSWGVGASGTYFNGHLFTYVGYREDQFKMKTRFVTVRPLRNQWVVDEIPGLFPTNQLFVLAKVHGSNYGGIIRVNDAFAIGYNWAQSFRISTGEGADTFRVGQKQGVPVGEGTEISAKFSLFPDKNDARFRRVEINLVRYHNYRPNDRFSPAINQQTRDELSALFPTDFFPTGRDYQTTTTDGYEVEIMTNITRTWRLMFNAGTNKVVTENRAPLLKGFQAEAKNLGQPTPLLDDFLTTIPEGVPNAGYTKLRGNVFTRYTFATGPLKGAFIGGGVQYRQRTYRGVGDHDASTATPVVEMWSPAYNLYSLLAGYSTRLFKRPVNCAVNVNNLFDKQYFRSTSVSSGSWGEPRAYRFSMGMDF